MCRLLILLKKIRITTHHPPNLSLFQSVQNVFDIYYNYFQLLLNKQHNL
jgi:hypothetical protein